MLLYNSYIIIRYSLSAFAALWLWNTRLCDLGVLLPAPGPQFLHCRVKAAWDRPVGGSDQGSWAPTAPHQAPPGLSAQRPLAAARAPALRRSRRGATLTAAPLYPSGACISLPPSRISLRSRGYPNLALGR